MQASYLPAAHHDLLRASGPDANRFLQGQLTCDVAALAPAGMAFGAICNTKGRVITPLVVYRDGDDYLLALIHPLGELLRGTLDKYRPFYKCSLEPDPSLQCLGLIGDGGAAQAPAAARHIELDAGRALLCLPAQDAADFLAGPGATLQADDGRLWRVASLLAGNYPFDASDVEQFTPQYLHYDRRDYVSFSKGCYTGQEIVARMHYRGKPKKQLYLVRLQAPLDEPPESLALLDDAGNRLAECTKISHDDAGIVHALAELAIGTLEQAGADSVADNTETTGTPETTELATSVNTRAQLRAL